MTDHSVTSGGTVVETLVSPDDEHAAHESHGLSDFGYVKIAIWLAIITAIEVAWSYIPAFEDAEGGLKIFEVGGLLFMMAIKFGVVAAYFMHLRFDDKLLTRVFYSGLVLAVGVYLAALFTFGIFL